MEKILNNIKSNNIRRAIRIFFWVIILSGIIIGVPVNMIISCIVNSEPVDMNIFEIILAVVFWGLIVMVDFFSIKEFIKSVSIIINPLKADVFKKYGSPEKIETILNEIESTKIYEDNQLIISSNYISNKNDYSEIVACKDVLGAHEQVHKTNFIIDYYQIVIIDRYNETIKYTYEKNEKDRVDQILMTIGAICHNAEIGYTKKEWENIRNNSTNISKNSKTQKKQFKCSKCGEVFDNDFEVCPSCNYSYSINDYITSSEEEFTCDNCGTIVSNDANKCPGCGSTFFESNEEDEEKYACDNCGFIVSSSTKKCPNCGESFEEEFCLEEERKINNNKLEEKKNETDMDRKYSDLNKLKKLLDKKIITKEEFEKEKKKILN